MSSITSSRWQPKRSVVASRPWLGICACRATGEIECSCLQHKTTTKIRSNLKISPKTPNDIIAVNGFVFRQGTVQQFALLGRHEKSIVSVHDLVQRERPGFHTALLVNLLPMRRLTVSRAIFYYFATAATTHSWEECRALGASIVTRIRGAVVVLTHHGRKRLDYRRISSCKVNGALGFPFASNKCLIIVIIWF